MRESIELKHGLLLVSGLVIASMLWLLPDAVAWLNRKPDEAWARVQQSGVIRFAIDPIYMPFDGLGSHNDFFGIDVDMANEIAKRIGARAEFVVTSYDSLYDVLAVGQADATISALIVDPSRTSKWKYSTAYFDAGQVLIRPVGFPKTRRVSLIAVEFGSDGDAAARHLARRTAGIGIQYFQSAEATLQAVATGQADAAIVDGISADQWLPKYPNLQRVDPLTHDSYAIAVWGESTHLLDAINRALDAMKTDGTMQRIILDWMKQ